VCPTHWKDPHSRNTTSTGLDLNTTRLHQRRMQHWGACFLLVVLLEVVQCRGEEKAERVKGIEEKPKSMETTREKRATHHAPMHPSGIYRCYSFKYMLAGCW